MTAIPADDLLEGDVYSDDEGATWHEVYDVYDREHSVLIKHTDRTFNKLNKQRFVLVR